MPKATTTKKATTVTKEERSEDFAEKAAIKAEKNTLKAAAKSGVVKVMFGLDPTMPKDHQFLEYCINGVIYRYQRGIMVEVPASVFETIERKEQFKRMSMQLYSGFLDGGKQLDV